MRVRTTSVSQHSVLVLGGKVTAEDAPELRHRLGELLAHDTGDMVICDLTGVRSADPQAMTVFASHHGLDGGPGPVVCIAGARADVTEVLEKLGIPRFVQVVPSVPAALDLARSRPPRLSTVRELAGNSSAPRLARRFALDVCTQWGLEDAFEDVQLVVAELVGNAVEHAGGDLVLRLERTTDNVMVAVRDSAGGFFESWWRGEHREEADGAAEQAVDPVWGHGLTIVRALAETAGVNSDAAGGKVVWAVLPARPARGEGAPPRPLRWHLVVNGGRGGQNDSSRWVVRLELAWLPDWPELVDLTLSSRPRHPSLPLGRWRVARSALYDGLHGPVRHREVRLWPDSSRRALMLELPGDPARVLRVSASRVRQFLAATGLPGAQPAAELPTQAGRAETTDATEMGPKT